MILTRRAEKEFYALPTRDRARVEAAIDRLCEQPRGWKSRKLFGVSREYRLTVWPYRVLYEIDDCTDGIRVFRIGHRKDVYR